MLWALVHRRWRLIISFGVSMVVLTAAGMFLIPTWPLDFVVNALAYSDYVAFGTPLENLLHYLLPVGVAAPLTPILSGLFVLMLLPGWWLALRGRPGAYTWAVMTTLIVGSLVAFRSATTNQVILYLPLFFFFYRLTLTGDKGKQEEDIPYPPRPAAQINTRHPLPATRSGLIATIQIGLLFFMWGVFVATIDGNWEHIMMHGLLPALMLLLYAVDIRGLWRASVHLARLGKFEPELPQ